MIDSPFLTVKDVAALFRLHEITVYRLLQKGQIPGSFKLGGRWRVKKDSIDKEFEGILERMI